MINISKNNGINGQYPLDTKPHQCHYISMVPIIRDKNFVKRDDGVKPDSRRRVILPKSLVDEGIMYHIYSNSMGQIILDPQVAIPASELWLFQNADVLASAKRGLADAAKGSVSRINLDIL